MMAVMRIHLDTDIGGDPDDACALAMLLGWPDVEITGITTVLDAGGRRAGYLAHVLELAHRDGIRLAEGAALSLTTLLPADPVIGDERYWPVDTLPHPSSPGAALDLLAHSIDEGATIVAIGPLTNLALLEITCPGSLRGVPVVAMGGWLAPPAEGLPAWGPEMDFNVQWDTRAVEIVAANATLTLVSLPATLNAHLRSADLPRLRAAGALGELLARQSQAHAVDNGLAALGPAHAGLPDDLLNFHYDPVTCAVAAGWQGAVEVEMSLRTSVHEGVLRFVPDPNGRETTVVTDVDGDAFAQTWLSAVERAVATSCT